MSAYLGAAAIENICLPSSYLHQIFKSYASDYVATDYILGLISQFVLAILNGPQSQDQDDDSFLAAQKHVYVGQVYTSACSVEVKQAMLSLPLNDLAYGVERRLREARRLDRRSQLHAVLDWVVACATHAAVDSDGEVGSVLKLHFRRQPILENYQNNIREHLEQSRMTGPGQRHGPLPALTHVLRRILKEEPPLRAASSICDMLRVFIQLAMDATEARLVGGDFSMLQENDPEQWTDTMQHGLEWVFYVTIKDPAQSLSLPGRYMLLEQNYKGLISFLL